MSNLTKTNIRVTINSEDKQKRAIEILNKHGERILEKHNSMEFSRIGIHLICRKKEQDWLVCYIERSNLRNYSEITLDQLDELLAKQEKEIIPEEIIPEIDEEFANYKQSLRLKKLGFERPCFALRGKSEGQLFKVNTDKFDSVDELHFIKAPTYSQAFRWFRKKYKLHPKVDIQDVELDWYEYEILEVKEGKYNNDLYLDANFKSYEEAESACLDKLLEIVESRMK